MAGCMHSSIDPRNNMCNDCYTSFDEDPKPEKIKFPKRMMAQKSIQSWYRDIKKEYERWEQNYDMPEGDFNSLESEYNTLRSVLGYRT